MVRVPGGHSLTFVRTRQKEGQWRTVTRIRH